MQFVYESAELEQELRAAKSVDAANAALRKLSALVPTFMAPEIRGRQMFCPGLDQAVAALARRVELPDVRGAKSNDNVCIVATGLYATGGHSRVAEDIARQVGAARVTIICTDIYGQLSYRSLMGGPRAFAPYAARSVSVLTAPSMLEKIVELYMLLTAIQPTRIFLMQNHMDAVAVAGCWPFRDVVDYVHHTDHMPGLGASLPFSAHADLTYACHRACADAGLQPIWAGMAVVTEDEAIVRRGAHIDGPLRFATCGATHKYLQPARYGWPEFAAAALRRPGAEFIHIGARTDELADAVSKGLSQAGVDPDRYRFVGPVPSLRRALADMEVDVYLGSYPDSGGRANLEAMAAGLAPIVPVPAEMGPLLHFESPLESWVRITSPQEVEPALARSLALSDELRTPAGRARLYEEFHRFERYVATPTTSS